MLLAKVLSTAIQTNRAGIEVLSCVCQLRKNQNVTAEWINGLGEAATPAIGDWIIVVPREQSFGGHFAFGFVDIINAIFAQRGTKIIFGRTSTGEIKTKVTLTDSDVIIENAESAQILLADENIIFNQGSGVAVEQNRLQASLDAFVTILLAEFAKVAAGTLPNPLAPYAPSPTLPLDTSPAKSETLKIP